MEYNNIFLFVVILFLFLCYCKKKIKKKRQTTQKYGLTKIKNKDNVIEYYTNLPGENCSQITKEFIKQMEEKQELIRFHEQQGETTEVNNLNSEINQLYNVMKQECSAQPRCRIKHYGPDDDDNLNNTICQSGNPENINNCRPASGTRNDIVSDSGEGNDLAHWNGTLRSNGSRFIKFNKVMTDSWENISISNQYMVDNQVIGPDDFEFELNQPMYYVIRYDKNNFDQLLTNTISDTTHDLFQNNTTFKVIPPIIDMGNDRASFNNDTINNENDFNRMKDILKMLFMKQELGEIYTLDEINQIERDYNENEEDDTVPDYIKGKYDEIIHRVNNFDNEEVIFTLKNMQANIIVESYKNIFDYCDFVKPNEPTSSNLKPKDIQKKIDGNEQRYYSNGDFNTELARLDCRNSRGEFIELMKNENNENEKNYYCISREPFTNTKNSYYYSYYDRTDNNRLINGADFDSVDEFKNRIKQSEIDAGRVEKRKSGIKSGDRIFSLAYDDLCKTCDAKFNGNGILSSIFDENTQDYKVTSCINGNEDKDDNGYIIDQESASREFYSIDKHRNFIKYTKVELDIEDQEESISESDYFSRLPTPST
jgi:hypothetical protein